MITRNREKLRHWISGDYNARHHFNYFLEACAMDDDLGDLSEELQEWIDTVYTGHKHAISDVLLLQSALDGKSNVGHTHEISDVNGLMIALNSRANAAHTHAMSDINGLSAALSGKADLVHTHSYNDLDDLPVLFSGDYDDLDNKPDLFSGSWDDLTDKPILFDWDYNSLFNKPTIPAAQIQSDWTQTNPSALDFIKNKPIKTFNNPSRALNTSFQISTTHDTSVSYTIPITAVAAILAGARGRVTLSYADDAAQTVNVKTVAVSEYGIGSGLVVTGYGVLELSGIIPVGKYVRLTSANVQGTPTFGSVVSQEVAI